MQEAVQAFERHFGVAPTHRVRAPGRVELLGNHTDYNQGLVMALAVDKCVFMAGARRDDNRVGLCSTACPDAVEFALDGKLRRDEAAPWANYVKGVIEQLRERGMALGGFNALIHSTIPLGAGLSSSAAILVATALLLRQLYPFSLTAKSRPRAPGANGAPELDPTEKLDFAQLCQAAENRFVGVNCGLLDHLASLFGAEDQVILIDCLNLTVEHTPFLPGVSVVVCHSGVRHALVAGEYNDRRRSCEAAARALGVPCLRAISLEALQAGRRKLTEHEHECALHVVGEIDRVARGAELLRAGKGDAFGQLLFQSHESSRVNFRNSCPELDLLVELARAHPACLGARLTGGGFGGATLNLVRRDAAEGFRAELAEGYRRRAGAKLDSWVCQVVGGAA